MATTDTTDLPPTHIRAGRLHRIHHRRLGAAMATMPAMAPHTRCKPASGECAGTKPACYKGRGSELLLTEPKLLGCGERLET